MFDLTQRAVVFLDGPAASPHPLCARRLQNLKLVNKRLESTLQLGVLILGELEGGLGGSGWGGGGEGHPGSDCLYLLAEGVDFLFEEGGFAALVGIAGEGVVVLAFAAWEESYRSAYSIFDDV